MSGICCSDSAATGEDEQCRSDGDGADGQTDRGRDLGTGARQVSPTVGIAGAVIAGAGAVGAGAGVGSGSRILGSRRRGGPALRVVSAVGVCTGLRTVRIRLGAVAAVCIVAAVGGIGSVRGVATVGIVSSIRVVSGIIITGILAAGHDPPVLVGEVLRIDDFPIFHPVDEGLPNLDLFVVDLFEVTDRIVAAAGLTVVVDREDEPVIVADVLALGVGEVLDPLPPPVSTH